jgi:hypothetical protein
MLLLAWTALLCLFAGCGSVHQRPYFSPNGDRLGAATAPQTARGRAPRVDVKVGPPTPLDPSDTPAGR